MRHVKNLEMSNIEVTTANDDARPAFWLNDISLADFFRIKASAGPSASKFAFQGSLRLSYFRFSRHQRPGVRSSDYENHLNKLRCGRASCRSMPHIPEPKWDGPRVSPPNVPRCLWGFSFFSWYVIEKFGGAGRDRTRLPLSRINKLLILKHH